MRFATICVAPPAMPVRLPPGRARSVTMPAATGLPTSVKTIGICCGGVLGGERGRFVVREDQVDVRLDQRPRLRRQRVALALGEMHLEGHVATFGKAPGAQARLQALDGRMIGGPGLVEDPDAIRARRLGLRRRSRQHRSRRQHDRATEQGMHPPGPARRSPPVRYFPDSANDSNESSAMLNHSYCCSRNFFQGS